MQEQELERIEIERVAWSPEKLDEKSRQERRVLKQQSTADLKALIVAVVQEIAAHVEKPPAKRDFSFDLAVAKFVAADRILREREQEEKDPEDFILGAD